MNLAAVIDEIGDRLDQIEGLHVYIWTPGTVVIPAAIVSLPKTIVYGETGNSDSMVIPVVILVGRPTDRPSRDAICAYCNGSGASSVRQVVESGTYTSCDSVIVAEANFDVITYGSIDYLAAVFDLNIYGSET